MSTAEELRNKQQLYYDDVEVGQEMPSLVIGPMTPTHAFRWSSAIENWHRIHYDQDFAIYHDGLPNILIQGSWKQSIMPRYLKDLCLPDGWMWKSSFQHRAMIVPGDTITCWSSSGVPDGSRALRCMNSVLVLAPVPEVTVSVRCDVLSKFTM